MRECRNLITYIRVDFKNLKLNNSVTECVKILNEVHEYASIGKQLKGRGPNGIGVEDLLMKK